MCLLICKMEIVTSPNCSHRAPRRFKWYEGWEMLKRLKEQGTSKRVARTHQEFTKTEMHLCLMTKLH